MGQNPLAEQGVHARRHVDDSHRALAVEDVPGRRAVGLALVAAPGIIDKGAIGLDPLDHVAPDQAVWGDARDVDACESLAAQNVIHPKVGASHEGNTQEHADTEPEGDIDQARARHRGA